MDLPVSVQTSLPVSEWVKKMFLKPKSACAQVSTLQKWHPYLQQGNVYNSSLLSEKLHALLGPVSYVDLDMAPQIPRIALPLSQVKERIGTTPPETWFTNGSSQGNTPTWPTSAVRLDFSVSWFEEGTKHSSQWAELGAV